MDTKLSGMLWKGCLFKRETQILSTSSIYKKKRASLHYQAFWRITGPEDSFVLIVSFLFALILSKPSLPPTSLSVTECQGMSLWAQNLLLCVGTRLGQE